MKSDLLIVHGSYSKKNLVQNYNVGKDKIVVIPHPNFSIYREWKQKGLEEDHATILFYGRIREYKGLEYFLEAALIINDKVPGVKIVIAGKGEIGLKYKEIIKRNDAIILINRFISNAETAELFQKASLLVLPYVDASQSGVLAISYAFGKPVVATNVGSLGEYVIDGLTGFLVPPRDSRALAEKAIELLENPEKRKTMGQNCRTFSKTIMADKKVARMTVNAYEKAIKR